MTDQITKALELARDGMFVPANLTKEIVSKIKVKKTASVLVLFSYEMLPVLKELGYQNVTLGIDKEREAVYRIAKYYGYKVINIEDLEDMKFDVVLGNPPYQEMKENNERKDKSSNLWSKFISLGIKISASNGYVAMITPNSWLSPSSDLKGEHKIDGESRLWDVFDTYSTYANVNDVAKHFKGVGSTFGYFVVNKSGHDGLMFSDNSDTSLGFLPKSGREKCVSFMSKNNNLGNKYKIDQENSLGWRVAVPASRVLTPESIEILSHNDKPSSGSENHRLYVYVYADSKKECEDIKNRIIECLDILNTHCRWSGFINIQTLKMIKV
jgi:hypothetical protein